MPSQARTAQPTLWTYLGVMLLVLVTLAGLTWMNYRFALANPGGNDFLARWMGAHMWLKEGLSPYDDRVSLASQYAIYGRPADASQGEDIAHFVYPLFSMLFFAPFGLLDYTLARALWMTVLEVTLVALTPLSLRLAGYRARGGALALWVLFGLLGYIGIRTIILGQFAGLNAFLIVVRPLSGSRMVARPRQRPREIPFCHPVNPDDHQSYRLAHSHPPLHSAITGRVFDLPSH